jgi:hypothetical protein
MKLIVLLLCFVCSFSSLSGSKSHRNRAKLFNSIKKTVADSSNSDSTSSEDSEDTCSQVVEPKINYSKTQKDYRKNILSRERNLKLCAEWDMEAAIKGNGIEEQPDADGQNNFHSEMEEVRPQTSVVSRIMAQYRRDLGFNEVLNSPESEPEKEEIQKIISCFESRPKMVDHQREKRRRERRVKRQMRRQALINPEDIWKASMKDERKFEWKIDRKLIKRGKRLKKVNEAYSFLKYLGKIPQFTFETLNGMTCEEIRAQLGNLNYFQDLRNFYKTELNYYTFLNWDNLDLTHFENHHFPIMNQITRNVTYNGNSKVVSPPVFMSRGVKVLEAYEVYIRFHNPRTLEGRRMLLFQRLYRRYLAAMGLNANPSFIDWEHCVVINWPYHIDRSNLNNWTTGDVLLLETLVEDEDLVFEKAGTLLKKSPSPLGVTENFYERPVITVNTDEIEGSDCAISDDEMICSRSARTIEEAIAEVSKAKAPAKRKYKKRKPKFVVNLESPEFHDRNIDPFPKVNNVKVVSDEPADEQKRTEVLRQALDIFRKSSGKKEAEEIDWKLLSVASFQNHLIPFSTGFETQGDVKTLEKLIKMEKLTFYNLETRKGRSNRTFERIYGKCGVDIGFNLDEFLIKWHAVEVEGWPEGVPRSYVKWKMEDIEAMESQLNSERLVFRLNEKYSELLDSSKDLLNSVAVGRDSSNNSPAASKGGLLLEEYSTKTVGPLYSNLKESSKTPSFASAALSPSNRKRPLELIKHARSDSFDLTEEDQLIPNVFDKKVRKIKATKLNEEDAKVGQFARYTRNEIDNFVASVNESITQYTAVRNSNLHCQRKNQILSEIIRALKIILKHTSCHKLSEIPAVSVDELNEFISICCDALLAVDAYGFLNDCILRLFIVKCVNLRALLSGAQGNINQTKIKKSILSDEEMFSFLVSDISSTWDIDFLEGFLDDDAMPIFKSPNRNKELKMMK